MPAISGDEVRVREQDQRRERGVQGGALDDETGTPGLPERALDTCDRAAALECRPKPAQTLVSLGSQDPFESRVTIDVVERRRRKLRRGHPNLRGPLPGQQRGLENRDETRPRLRLHV